MIKLDAETNSMSEQEQAGSLSLEPEESFTNRF
jgi:hypothetical protein